MHIAARGTNALHLLDYCTSPLTERYRDRSCSQELRDIVVVETNGAVTRSDFM